MTDEWHSPTRGGPEGQRAAMDVFNGRRLRTGPRGARQRPAQAFDLESDNVDFDATEHYTSLGGGAATSPANEMPGEGGTPSLKVTRGGHPSTPPDPAVQQAKKGLKGAISSIKRAPRASSSKKEFPRYQSRVERRGEGGFRPRFKSPGTYGAPASATGANRIPLFGPPQSLSGQPSKILSRFDKYHYDLSFKAENKWGGNFDDYKQWLGRVTGIAEMEGVADNIFSRVEPPEGEIQHAQWARDESTAKAIITMSIKRGNNPVYNAAIRNSDWKSAYEVMVMIQQMNETHKKGSLTKCAETLATAKPESTSPADVTKYLAKVERAHMACGAQNDPLTCQLVLSKLASCLQEGCEDSSYHRSLKFLCDQRATHPDLAHFSNFFLMQMEIYKITGYEGFEDKALTQNYSHYTRGHGYSRGRQRGQKGGECFNCGRHGHWARECPEPKTKERARGDKYKRQNEELQESNRQHKEDSERYQSQCNDLKAMLSDLRVIPSLKSRAKKHGEGVQERQPRGRPKDRGRRHHAHAALELEIESGDEDEKFNAAFKLCKREAATFSEDSGGSTSEDTDWGSDQESELSSFCTRVA